MAKRRQNNSQKRKRRTPCLVSLTGVQTGQHFTLLRERVTIGKGDLADMSILDLSVASRHAEVFKSPHGRWKIRDLGTGARTAVNGRSVKEFALKDQDHIQLGDGAAIRFEYHVWDDIPSLDKVSQKRKHDKATGAFTRGYVESHLDSAMKLSRRHREPLSLLMVDVDHLSKINAAHGRPVGDAVLSWLASTISKRMRTDDLLARYGGEEFLVALLCTPQQGAVVLAESLRELVAKRSIKLNGTRIDVTITVGVVTMTADADFPSPKSLVIAASRALFRAKKEGRNRVEVASPEDGRVGR